MIVGVSMEKQVLSISNAEQKIIALYKKVHRIVFRYTIFVLALFIWIFVALSITKISQEFIYEEPAELLIKKIIIKEQFEKYLSQDIGNEDLEIFILQWTLIKTGNYIKSYNNLLSYKWFVVPRYFVLFQTAPLKPLSYFASWDYQEKDLEIFAQNVIFTPVQKDTIKQNSVQLPITESLVNTFNLECLFKNNILEGTCSYYIENFIDQFYLYDLWKDFSGLEAIYNEIKKDSENKKMFCKNIKKYILYSNETNRNLENIFRWCGAEYWDDYIMLEWFIELKQQLHAGYLLDSLYSSHFLNKYKLLSLQQVIFNELNQKRLNSRLIEPYLKFVQKMLKRWELNWFYADLTYRFHTKYLKPRLSDPNYSLNKNEATNLIDSINEINKWSELIGFVWLSEQILNTSILVDQTSYEEEKKGVLSIEELVKPLEYLSYLTVLQKTIEESYAQIEGNFLVSEKDRQYVLPVVLRLEQEWNIVLVKEINVKWYDQLTRVLNSLLQKNQFSTAYVYQYIVENIGLYAIDSSEIEYCDIIIDKNPKLKVKVCNENGILFEQSMWWTTIRYQIVMDEAKLWSLKITDKALQLALNNELKWEEVNKLLLPDLISFITNYSFAEEELNDNQLSENYLIVVEKMKQYLNIIPKHVEEKWDKIFVSFVLWNEDFFAEFDLVTTTLSSLYFESVFLRPSMPLPVKDFSLELVDNNRTEINNFIADPIEYIKSISENAYKAYLKYK